MQSSNVDILSLDGTEIAENHSIFGVITNVLVKSKGDEWNGFVVDGKPDEALIGQYIMVKHPDGTSTGYKITGVVEKDNKYIVDIGTNEPGFVFVGEQRTKMMYYPHTERTGTTEFTIDHTQMMKDE